MTFDLDSYKTVPERIAEFKVQHPDGCLRPADLAHPYRIETIGNQTYIVYVAAAYRSPDDQLPGIGAAWELVPGKTQFTKDSELQNAETSAWGRAIVAALRSDTASGVATREEVRSRRPAVGGGPLATSPDSAPEGRRDEVKLAAVAAKIMPWINQQKFPVPWSDATCDAIEAHLNDLAQAS